MAAGFSNPVTAGNMLVQPAIQSPNFSIPGQTGWAVQIGGQAYFFSITAVGPISTAAEITVGQAGGSEITLNPDANQAFDVTTAIAGFLQAVEQFITTDASEVVAGALGSLLLGTGSATKMSTALTSAFGSSGAAILLESENDGGTDTPVITFGTITTPDGGTTVVYAPIATLSPYAFLVYSGASGQTVVTKTSGSGTIPVPAGVTVAKGESWGASAGGENGVGASTGGGGAYSCEPALAVAAPTAAFAVGAAGAGGTASGSEHTGTAGGSSTLTGTSVTVTASGGLAATAGGNPGSGGPVSGNTVSFPGGAGGNSGGYFNGAGGGSSAGPGGAGNPGGTGNAGSPGNGGAAPAGGGKGGNGGQGYSVGNPGSAGQAPGGAGGAGGYDASSGIGAAGGAGAAGMVRLTYTSGAPPILFSVAAAAGTDQFGTAYPAGVYTANPVIIEDPTTAGIAETWHKVVGGPGFQNGWTDRHAVSGTYPPTAYRLAADSGDVMINIHAVAGTLTNGTILWTMPSAYIPGSTQIIPVAADMSAAPNATSGTPCILIRGAGDSNPGAVEAYNLGTVTTRIHNAGARYSLAGG